MSDYTSYVVQQCITASTWKDVTKFRSESQALQYMYNHGNPMLWRVVPVELGEESPKSDVKLT